jgi:hypothetical protein
MRADRTRECGIRLPRRRNVRKPSRWLSVRAAGTCVAWWLSIAALPHAGCARSGGVTGVADGVRSGHRRPIRCRVLLARRRRRSGRGRALRLVFPPPPLPRGCWQRTLRHGLTVPPGGRTTRSTGLTARPGALVSRHWALTGWRIGQTARPGSQTTGRQTTGRQAARGGGLPGRGVGVAGRSGRQTSRPGSVSDRSSGVTGWCGVLILPRRVLIARRRALTGWRGTCCGRDGGLTG